MENGKFSELRILPAGKRVTRFLIVCDGNCFFFFKIVPQPKHQTTSLHGKIRRRLKNLLPVIALSCIYQGRINNDCWHLHRSVDLLVITVHYYQFLESIFKVSSKKDSGSLMQMLTLYEKKPNSTSRIDSGSTMIVSASLLRTMTFPTRSSFEWNLEKFHFLIERLFIFLNNETLDESASSPELSKLTKR